MQGSWVSANINLTNSGPLIRYDRSGDLNINYTLIPSPKPTFYEPPVFKPIEIKPPRYELPKYEPLDIKLKSSIFDKEDRFSKKKSWLDR
jgi:hypothetical protein